MFNEGISSSTEKYRFLTGFWPREELSDYYKMTERCERSYNSLKNFFINRDNQLAAILDKVPVWNECTNFNKIFSTAVSFAKSPEQDRIKFFLAYLMPFSIKDKIREHYNESLEIFKRKGQAIWNAHKENALIPKQVNYDKLQQFERNHFKFNKNYHKQCRPNHQQDFDLRDNNSSYNYNYRQHNQDRDNFKP